MQSGQLQGLVAEVRRGKALAMVMEAATITDASGQAIDLEDLRDDLVPSAPEDTEFDDEWRPFLSILDCSVH